MKKNIRVIVLLILVVVFASLLFIWASHWPIVANKSPLYNFEPAIQLAFDFSGALSMNDPKAYDMIDPSLKPRLDAWMNSHKPQKCIRDVDYSFISDGTNIGKKIKFGCFTETSYLSYEVDDIVIKDMKVIDWGEVREGD